MIGIVVLLSHGLESKWTGKQSISGINIEETIMKLIRLIPRFSERPLIRQSFWDFI